MKALERSKQQNLDRKANGYYKKYYIKNKQKMLSQSKEYYQNPISKEKRKEYYHRLDVKQRNKICRKKHPESYKRARKKYAAKNTSRERKKGFILLMINPFPNDIEVHFHHIRRNLPFVISLPKITHQLKNGNSLKNHEDYCDMWIEKIYCVNIKNFYDKVNQSKSL